MKTVVTYTDDWYSFAVIAAEYENNITLMTHPSRHIKVLSTVVTDKNEKVRALAIALAGGLSRFDDLQALTAEHELDWVKVVNLALPVGTLQPFYNDDDDDTMYLSNTGQGLMRCGYFLSPDKPTEAIMVIDTLLYPYNCKIAGMTVTHSQAKSAPSHLLLSVTTQLIAKVL